MTEVERAFGKTVKSRIIRSGEDFLSVACDVSLRIQKAQSGRVLPAVSCGWKDSTGREFARSGIIPRKPLGEWSSTGFFKKNAAKCRVLLVENTDRLYRNLKDYVVLDDFNLDIHLVKEGQTLSRDSRSSQSSCTASKS